MRRDRSAGLLRRARALIPGGVNSPVRAFAPVGVEPPFIARGAGARIWDVDGNEYLDYVCSWGPLILGHAHPTVVDAVREAASEGTSFGAPTEREVELAELIAERMPSVEMVRLVNSGTEAAMTALRLSRAWTGRAKLVKFAGCYHGHADPFLVKAGSGGATLALPDSAGVPAEVAGQTLVAEFNDLDCVRRLMEKHEAEVAAIVMEPVCGNAGVIPPEDGFLHGLRQLASDHGAVLIFDEVMTGFRVAPGGAQALYGVMPDLTVLGKVIGGGLPIGAVGGRAEIMQMLAPAGPVYQAGTLSGNSLAVAAGLATLRTLTGEVYRRLEALGLRLEEGVCRNLRLLGLPYRFQRVGSMACLFFADRPVLTYGDAQGCDRERFARYFRAMLAEGIYLPPSQFEAFFLSAAHCEGDIDRTVEANLRALQSAA